MNNNYEVRWTKNAISDLEAIASYIKKDSPHNAQKIAKKLKEKAESLAHTPARGRIVPELLQMGLKNWRELIVKPYRIIYQIRGEKVFIFSIIDSRRDVEDILLEYLLR